MLRATVAAGNYDQPRGRARGYPNERQSSRYSAIWWMQPRKTEASATLGNRDNRLIFQTLKLQRRPLLTCIPTLIRRPEVPELQIYVSGRLWQRVASFFGRGLTKKSTSSGRRGQQQWVQFGDGETGHAVLRALRTWRQIPHGTGAFGALKLNTKVQGGAKARSTRQDSRCSDGSTGGSLPESATMRATRRRGRFQAWIVWSAWKISRRKRWAISGVTKAAAAWQLLDTFPR